MNLSVEVAELAALHDYHNSEPVINARTQSYVRSRLKSYLGGRWDGVEVLPADTTYYCVIHPDLERFVAADATSDLAYTDERFDCDDMARRMVANAKKVGITGLGYVRDDSANHAYCINVPPGEAHDPTLIEPQSGRLVDPGAGDLYSLTDAEIRI